MIVLLFTLIKSTSYTWDIKTSTLVVYTDKLELKRRDIDFDMETVQHLVIKGKAQTVEDYFMANNPNLITLEFKGAKKINKAAFSGCTNLTYFTIPNSCECIDENAFEGTNIRKIIIPKGWKSIKSGAFLNSKLEAIIIKEPGTKLFDVGEKAFYSTNLKKVIYLGKSHLSFSNIAILPDYISQNNILVPESYHGKNFLNRKYTKTDAHTKTRKLSEDQVNENPNNYPTVNRAPGIIIVVIAIVALVVAIIVLAVLHAKSKEFVPKKMKDIKIKMESHLNSSQNAI